MKNFLTGLLITLSITASAQWTFEKKEDPFDGNYFVAMGRGTGGRFPYTKPLFVINKINGRYNIYVTDMGSTSCDELELLITTDVSDKAYSFNLSESRDGDTVFLSSNMATDMRDMLQDFKKGRVAHFKYTTGCSTNQWAMSLSGSSAAIDSTELILWLEDLIELEKELQTMLLKYVDLWKEEITVKIQPLFDSFNIEPPYYEGDLHTYITRRFIDEIIGESGTIEEYIEANMESPWLATGVSIKQDGNIYRVYKNFKNGDEVPITLVGWRITKK